MESIPSLNSILGAPSQAQPDMAPQTQPNSQQPQSRFSQFFQRPPAPATSGQQPNNTNSRRSSIQDELLGANILREINGGEQQQPTVRIPSPTESNAYFAPISPAAKTSATTTNSLLDMINKGQTEMGAMPPNLHMPRGGKNVNSVEELEAGLKRHLGLQHQQQQKL